MNMRRLKIFKYAHIRMLIMSRAKILFIVLTMAFSSYGKAMRQFIDLSVNAKNEMMQEFVQHFKDDELMLIKTRAEDVVYSRWSNQFFSNNIFNALFLEDFYPSYLSVNCLTLKEERLKWYNEF